MIYASDVNIVPLSSFTWSPVYLDSNYNSLSINQQDINFTNGLKLNIAPAHVGAKDVTINNNSLVLLTDTVPVSKMFKENITNVNTKKLINYSALSIYHYIPAVTATSVTNNSGTITYSVITITPEQHINITLSTTPAGDVSFIKKDAQYKNELFTFNFVDDYVTISNGNKLYLTDFNTAVYFQPLNNNITQKFNYILNDSNIILFKYNSNFTQILKFDTKQNTTKFETISDLSNITDENNIVINYLEDLNTDTSSIKDSFIAKYITNTLTAVNSIELDKDVKSLNYSQNYLLNIPIFNTKLTNTYTGYINSLKNYQTSNYEYSLSNNEPVRRQYTNIFTGNSQQHGHNNIYLNYTANTYEKTFKKDTETIFHYPCTIDESGIKIEQSGLYEEGAIASKIPFLSDRIMYSQRDYRELGIPVHLKDIVNGVWLCAWLSAGDNGDAAWMDRYYRGAVFDVINQEYLLHIPNDPLVIDVPSSMMLLPGRIYKYFRQGQQNYKTYVNTLSSIDRDNSTKVLEITDWSNTILQDESIYKNDGSIALNTETLTQDYLSLDGKNYAIFPASPSLEESKQLTISFWFNVDNWSQVKGRQIFGNFSDGGIGLFNNQSIPTTFVTLYDSYNGYVYNFNSELKIISEQSILNSSSSPLYSIRATDQNYWMIDSNTLKAYQYDLNDNVLNTIDISSLNTVTQVEVDSSENIYVVDNTSNKIISFNSYTGGSHSSLINMRSTFNRIEIVTDYNGVYTGDTILPLPSSTNRKEIMIGICGEQSTVDAHNNVWSTIGINLYKNKDYFASIGKIIQISCDAEGNVWIIHDYNKVTKINSEKNTIEFTKIFTSPIIDNITNIQSRFINFITCNINNEEIDNAIIIDNQEKVCYFINLQGNLRLKINLLSIPTTFLAKHNFNRKNINFTAFGDFTGYQYQRKFSNRYEFVWNLYTTLAYSSYNNSSKTKIQIPFSVKYYEPGWHHFALSFDHIKGRVDAYVDSKCVGSKIFNEPFSYKIKQSTKTYAVGAVTTGKGILNDNILNEYKYKIIGKFAHLSIYKYAFDQYDINALFRSTYIDNFNDLVWNINIGRRNYIEQIERFFMKKMPGNKSKFFNLKIKNFPATALQKQLIEQAINNTFKKIAPADTILNKIIWVS